MGVGPVGNPIIEKAILQNDLASTEPAWNPGVEAVDCLYRLGAQAHEVCVYWYFVQGTLEMNINQVQRQKGELAVYALSELIVTCMHSSTDGRKFHFLVS
ncbi:uncharacterized protein VP01_5011g1 [Puccinia sorghi]|uniref:Uncharacterized protein n=1 Tax=Puccinia sorghi TaxID=27349 RepID=A0A0L6UNN4_9BASI|nr:uncharacterized protein VP01_5011g1 [Puccinia sorghi]